MTLFEHAKHELELAGYFEPDEDGMNKVMANDVLELIKVLGEQGHSGMSAPFCIQLFTQLASYKPLGSLTGKDDEWNQITDNLWQNNRCSHVFKDKTHAWDINVRVFRDPDGSCWTNGDSKVDVVFPYTPSEPEIINRKEV